MGLPPVSVVIDSLRGSHFAEAVISLAGDILAHRFPLFGSVLDTGPEIHWRRDYERGVETRPVYFRLLPYLDAARAGDHKYIWELSRHQHLVVLAQAFRFNGRREFLEEIQAQLESWMEQNPYLRGINWVSALEVAFRSMSWIWVLHLVGESLPVALHKRVMLCLYQHGLCIENNLSVYFSPNTHLLGEAVALYALGRLLPHCPAAKRWEAKGDQWIEHELRRQVREDGAHFEQSSYYHVYALDMFLFYSVLSGTLDPRLERMAEYLAALLGPERRLPFLGDDDGGRWFHPYGARDEFGRATLATCGILFQRPEWILDPCDLEPQAVWWLGPRQARAGEPRFASRLFEACGVAVMTDGEHQIIVDGGPFGPWRAGHSHSDTLSTLVRGRSGEILVDPGTFTYVGDPDWRNRFRGSAAHNTMRVDGLDQADPDGPFGWANLPATRILAWDNSGGHAYFDAECGYRGLTHRRRVLWIKPGVVLVLDEIRGPDEEHAIEQFWHTAQDPVRVSGGCLRVPGALLVFGQGAQPRIESAWRAPVFGTKTPAPLIRLERRERLPSQWATALLLGQFDGPAELQQTALGWALKGPLPVNFTVPAAGAPQYDYPR